MDLRKYISLFLSIIVAANCFAQNNSNIKPPGLVIDHLAKETGRYIGSPSICILQHPDPSYHAFQYVDWMFDADDIIFVSRTAFGINDDRAENAHNANYLTIHRIHNFKDN